MRDNGERIYTGLMEREEMHILEEENQPPQEKDFRVESDTYRLSNLVNGLLQKEHSCHY